MGQLETVFYKFGQKHTTVSLMVHAGAAHGNLYCFTRQFI